MKVIRILILLVMGVGLFIHPDLVLAEDDTDYMAKCEPYRDLVENILESESVSTDFYYLMVAESRCTVRAESEKGAKGFWQLMPSTSKHYGCNNPHDLECATRAAARYIRHLQKQFHRFDEVIMAYNMGGHNYKRTGSTREARGLVWMVNKLKENPVVSGSSENQSDSGSAYSIFIPVPKDTGNKFIENLSAGRHAEQRKTPDPV